MDILSSKNKALSKALTMRIQKYSDLLHDELLYRTSLMSAALHKQTCRGTNPLVYLSESNKAMVEAGAGSEVKEEWKCNFCWVFDTTPYQ